MKMSLEEATMKALLGELEDIEPKDDVEGIVDGIMVVTDPEITPDEYEEVIDKAQEILEDTPEGEVPFNDQYVGEYLLTCPICGSSFINKDVLNVGDSCPICTEVPEQGFILNGQVATQEDVELQNDIQNEEAKAENDDVNIGFEEEEVEEEPISEEDVEETEEELLASEVQRTADNKLEESDHEDLIIKTFKDAEGDLKVDIIKAPNGRYFNYYYANDMEHPTGNAGPFKSEEEAEKMVHKHRPTVKEVQRTADNKLEESKELDEKYIKRMTTNKLNENKQLTESTNKYKELRDRHQEEFNKFPIKFAFSDEQFKKAMEELGLTENDTDKVVGIGASGFIRKSDVDEFNKMNKRHREEEKEAMDADTTGEGYIKDMFEYELANHEYGYTYDLDDTLDALDLTIDEINNDPKLKHGLDLALKRYKDSDELEESKENYIKRPEQLNEVKEIKTENVSFSNLEEAGADLWGSEDVVVEDTIIDGIYNCYTARHGGYLVDTDIFPQLAKYGAKTSVNNIVGFEEDYEALKILWIFPMLINNEDFKNKLDLDMVLHYEDSLNDNFRKEFPTMGGSIIVEENKEVKTEGQLWGDDSNADKKIYEKMQKFIKGLINTLTSSGWNYDDSASKYGTYFFSKNNINIKYCDNYDKIGIASIKTDNKEILKRLAYELNDEDYRDYKDYVILDFVWNNPSTFGVYIIVDRAADKKMENKQRQLKNKKTEDTNKYIPAEEKLEAIYDDYKSQGMAKAYWTDLLNIIDDFNALDRWFDASFPEPEDKEDLDEEWEKLEEE